MTNTYTVHIYREMRLVFSNIEADCQETAAEIARDKATNDADEIDECDGETFYACVDLQGDDDYEQSRWVIFEPERIRVAAPKLLAALIDLVGDRDIDEQGNCHHCGREYPGEHLICCPAEDCAGNIARAAIAATDIVNARLGHLRMGSEK